MTGNRSPSGEGRGPRLEGRAARVEGRGPKVALVHDWLTGMRGGEKVLEAIAELYPEAPIHTLLQARGRVSTALESRRIVRSFVQWLPGITRHYRSYLPLFPTAIEQFDFDGYDLVISTSHCAAKAVVVPGRARHVCYCHTPMRYAWDQFDAYFGPERVGAVQSRLYRPMLARLARWDAATASRVDRFVANSAYVAGRIGRYYNRVATVVYPPVDTDFYQPDPAPRPESFFLVVSALVPYKRVDVAIHACAAVGARLKIVGQGPEERRLRGLCSADVEFLGWQRDEAIRRLYQGCQAVLMTGIEDFGMVPVEAQACGRPVVALAEGGALESVIHGTTGLLVRDLSVEAFAEAVREVSSRSFDSQAIRRHAESFARPRFQEQFQAVVGELLATPPSVARGFSPADPAPSVARGFSPADPAPSVARGFSPADPAPSVARGFSPADPAQLKLRATTSEDDAAREDEQ